MAEWVTLLGNSSVRLETLGGQTIYIDPWRLPDGLPRAALIVITHPHHDHCSPEDVQRLCGPETEILAPEGAAQVLREKGVQTPVHVCRPGQTVRVGAVTALAVEAYNVNKWRAPGTPFHPRGPDFLGWVLDFDRGRVYHAGDTDLIPPEVRAPIDVALVPVSGKFVATAREAADEVNRLRPALAIPMHYGAVAGSRADADEFARLVQVPVKVLL